MNNQNALQLAANLEKQLAEAIAAAADEVKQTVINAESPEIRQISPQITIVNYKQLGDSWHPDYYNLERQKQQVVNRLSDIKTLSSLRNTIKNAITDKKLILHPVIIKVLQQALDTMTETN